MLPSLRRARVIGLLRRDGAARLKQMPELLLVWVSALRPDVHCLCVLGHLKRSFGRAILRKGSHARVTIAAGATTHLGDEAMQSAPGLCAYLALHGAPAVSETEMSGTKVALTKLKRVISAAAEPPIPLADNSMIFTRTFLCFGRIDALQRLIADSRVHPRQVVLLFTNGAKVDPAAIGA